MAASKDSTDPALGPSSRSPEPRPADATSSGEEADDQETILGTVTPTSTTPELPLHDDAASVTSSIIPPVIDLSVDPEGEIVENLHTVANDHQDHDDDGAAFDHDADSALGEARPDSSVSATESIYNFIHEFGRTFHRYKAGKYFMPNDEREQERLDMKHTMALMLLDHQLNLAPVEQLNRVLDIGTGTGIWAIEFAETHPESDVLGTDLSPIQPSYVPPNSRFEVDDFEDEWVFSSKFDYIHGRDIAYSIANPLRLLTRIYDNLQPGGWVEFLESVPWLNSVDGTLEGTATQRWNRLLLQGIRRLSRDALTAARLPHFIRQAGFQNVVEKRFAVPVNQWARGEGNKALGQFQLVSALEGLHAISMKPFIHGLGWAEAEVEILLADVRKELVNPSIHSFVTIFCVYGQKPR